MDQISEALQRERFRGEEENLEVCKQSCKQSWTKMKLCRSVKSRFLENDSDVF